MQTTPAKAKLDKSVQAHVNLAQVDLVKVDKSQNKMFLLKQGKIVKSYRIALGGKPKGHKQYEGDQRTPEGRYTLDYIKEDSAFYRAMHISYPNQADITQAKNQGRSPGGQIMVHGQRDRAGWRANIAQRLNWTNGCIALKNHEMDEFIALVDVGTPIEIRW
ncbi:L,D-transpeptidase family protein [Thalassotalea sp. PLHSN55]|uniref:L,D-transpeptidase family protein n=1 Tax=Thalassotalea sp. PLHSN55 TaxID=3435888 RepID=UPI003F852550